MQIRRTPTSWLLALMLPLACAGNPDRQTLADLHRVAPDMKEVQVQGGRHQAMRGYREFLAKAPTSALTPEAMRRLADLQLEKEFGIAGAGGAKPPAPEPERIAATTGSSTYPAKIAADTESEGAFEVRAAAASAIETAAAGGDLELPGQDAVAWAGPEEAIVLYDRILDAYPDYPNNDQVLYQKARAYDELGRNDDAIAVIEEMISRYPNSEYFDEVQFRRGEYFFTRRKYYEAELAYAAAVSFGKHSAYYELALYKLGWSLYKQEMHEEALHRYIALLDYKVDNGYDFDNAGGKGEEQRVADTYRVISLSFSSLGGPQAVVDYFAARGRRDYEDRIYSRLGDFYLEKRRYNDAAQAYASFIALNPHHRTSPRFGMRIVEIYESGGFPKLVLEAKKDFASRYSLDAEYWQHIAVEDAPEVVDALKGNLEDLATHFHAVFQNAKHVEERPANFQEASHWYRAYLASFAADPEASGIHYRLADLLLENEDFPAAAQEYEHTAYRYSAHEKSAAAGYAAIFAHREHETRSEPGEARDAVRREAVASTLRFVEAFADHEHAAVVLGAAVDDLYAMGEYERAIARGQQLVENHAAADPAVVRAAFATMAHSHFDMQTYALAEADYSRVLELTAADDPARQDVTENLAAAIYKQGEQAKAADDHRLAADHFLRIKELAPESAIRPAAEYDAGAALIELEDWAAAAAVLEVFRETHPDHELQREATKQIASVYRASGNPVRAAEEYERVADEADVSELRREALLIAGELYEDANKPGRALAIYLDYVKQFPSPLETAIETRFKVAELYAHTGDSASREEQLRKIVALEKQAGSEAGDRVRDFAARSALALAMKVYDRFAEVQLVQPFERNLKKKKQRMDEALREFEALVEYQVAEATAGATYLIAEVYFEFSRALLESQRPRNLSDDELAEYNFVLEEEAYPFEEQAIEVHQKNLELMRVGVYNGWIEKSLFELAEMMPGRYAKFEESSGPIASIDEYAYQVPRRPAPQTAPVPEAAPALDGDVQPEASEPTQQPLPTLVESARYEHPVARLGNG